MPIACGYSRTMAFGAAGSAPTCDPENAAAIMPRGDARATRVHAGRTVRSPGARPGLFDASPEHTAWFPRRARAAENLFKGESDAINAFVCTPTLELGVDIGQLDAVLMRNVPPLPANYWQRAGRAGRRHRMAVDLTYCRPVSHDRAYFAEPLKLLAGQIDPPAFNLRNELMVAKHVHATVITRLHQYTRDTSRSEADRRSVEETLKTCLPDRVSAYLFENGVVRNKPFDLAPLQILLDRNVDVWSPSGERLPAGWRRRMRK